MTRELGPQYDKDDSFKARARLHQSRFRAEELGLDCWNEYGNRLAAEDAAAGKNFYAAWSGLLKTVNRRYEVGDTALCRDMLRSEHIPFNFFVPLVDEPDLLVSWLRAATGQEAARSRQVAIEWAPSPAVDYLDDHTSFDAYVEYESAQGDVGAVGIEVKYTEGEYNYGRTEKARMFAETSPYHRVHECSGLYLPNTIPKLRTKRFKQLWRNHLLGEAMVQQGEIQHFTSLILFPRGNQHFNEVTVEYPEFLAAGRQSAFVGQTFEEFISTCRVASVGSQVNSWLDYLKRRYVHD